MELAVWAGVKLAGEIALELADGMIVELADSA